MTTIINREILKTISQGALGAISFGIYHQFVINKKMEMNNNNIELTHKYYIDKLKLEHKNEMNELNEKINKLESKWWIIRKL